ncbi:MAG TPA: bifunctional DNA-formamidopyrimidine glycosylase/DNA-(apurinic or apyrimidinic site) lyase [Tepidisphaeraceae bacterium]
MPELPEVQTVVSGLAPRILGQRIVRIELLRPDILHPAGVDLAKHLSGQRVEQLTRRAKRIVFTLQDSNRFYIHLGMSGRLTAESAAAEIPKHTHLILHFAKFDLRFRDPRRFGGIWWLGAEPDPDTIGPEPLLMRSKQLAARLSKTRRVIKTALMDQTLIAGLGNIYADESLFEARIHPLTPANRLKPEQIRRLNRAIKITLRRALRHRGSTLRDYVDAEGGSGAFQKLHRVYDRTAQPCRICKTPIVRIVVGGRSTHFCPHCQKRA